MAISYALLHSQCLTWFLGEGKSTINVYLMSKAEGKKKYRRGKKKKPKTLKVKKKLIIIVQVTLLQRVIIVI